MSSRRMAGWALLPSLPDGPCYYTDCFPHEVHDGEFEASGEALEVPAHQAR